MLFIGWRKKINSLRAGMRSQTVCEKWEARRKDLFNKLGRSCGRNQILKKKETMLEEKHTLTKMKTKISKYQKLKTKKDKKTTNGEKSFSSKRLLHSDLSRISPVLHSTSCQTFSISLRIYFILIISSQNIYFSIILYSSLFMVLQCFTADPTCSISTYLSLYSFTVPYIRSSVCFHQPGVADGWGLLLFYYNY